MLIMEIIVNIIGIYFQEALSFEWEGLAFEKMTISISTYNQ